MSQFPLLIKYEDESKENAEVWVEGTINKTKSRFLLDTGCAITALMFNEVFEELPSSETNESSGAIGKTKNDLILINSLVVGPLFKEDIKVSRGKKGELDRNLLGMNFLKDYCLYFQFDQNIVQVLDRLEENQIDLFMDKGFIPYVDVKTEKVAASAVWDLEQVLH